MGKLLHPSCWWYTDFCVLQNHLESEAESSIPVHTLFIAGTDQFHANNKSLHIILNENSPIYQDSANLQIGDKQT